MQMKDNNNNNNNFPIQCGKCKCKYFPRFKSCPANETKDDSYVADNSCPQCGFGNIDEKLIENKKLLLG